MSLDEVLEVTIPAALAGSRLDRALTEVLKRTKPEFSRARLQALIERGRVTKAGHPLKSVSAKAKDGDTFRIAFLAPEPAAPKPEKIKLDILFEDKDLIVINKAAGMVVHPAPGNRDRTLVNALLAHCEGELSGIGGVARPGIVHRLDKETSGLMVVAKNDLAHQNLTAQFADRSLSRVYKALVWGKMSPTQGKIDAPIGRSPRDRKKMAVVAKGRNALTHYKLLEDLGPVSLLECRLETGRTHQIRVHLAHKGHPLVGDPAYGRGRAHKGGDFKPLQSFPRQALHASELRFNHPRSGKVMNFQAELPKDIKKLLQILAKN